MRKGIHSTILLLSLMIVWAGSYAYAGTLTVNIRHPFITGGKSLPAGHYRINAEDNKDQFLNIQNLNMETSFLEMQFDRRISPRDGENGSVGFDKVGNELYLARIYIIGMDGFYFKGAPGKHKHLVVKQETEY